MILDGRVAVVTGGGYGIGRSIALALGRAGATTIVSGRSADALRDVAREITEAGGTADAVRADVTQADDVEALAATVVDRHGSPDVLVNNSGIAGPTRELWEIDPDEWDDTFAVNVRGVFLVCRAFVPAMLERGDGAVITIGSMTGKRPLTGRTPYAASKTALIGLTRTLAHEAGRHGVRVNLVSPGGVEGPRIDRVLAELATREGLSDEQARQRFTDASATGQLVSPDDVADAVVFLASDAARGITGEDLNVSAGAVMY